MRAGRVEKMVDYSPASSNGPHVRAVFSLPTLQAAVGSPANSRQIPMFGPMLPDEPRTLYPKKTARQNAGL
jgi:hypothetical protein